MTHRGMFKKMSEHTLGRANAKNTYDKNLNIKKKLHHLNENRLQIKLEKVS